MKNHIIRDPLEGQGFSTNGTDLKRRLEAGWDNPTHRLVSNNGREEIGTIRTTKEKEANLIGMRHGPMG